MEQKQTINMTDKDQIIEDQQKRIKELEQEIEDNDEHHEWLCDKYKKEIFELETVLEGLRNGI